MRYRHGGHVRGSIVGRRLSWRRGKECGSEVGGGKCLDNVTSELWPVIFRWVGPGPRAVVNRSVQMGIERTKKKKRDKKNLLMPCIAQSPS